MARIAQAAATSPSRPSRGFAYFMVAAMIGSLLLFPPVAFAHDQPIDVCKDPISQNEATVCAGQDADKANSDMVVALARAKKAMRAVDVEFASKLYPDPVTAIEALELSQRGWLQYREGHCIIAGFAEHGGSMEPMVISECLEGVTRVRIAELNKIAEPE